MPCGSSSISDTSSWGIWAPSSLPNPPTAARAAAWQPWQHCPHPPDLPWIGGMGEKHTSQAAGTLDCLCHMGVERLKTVPSAVLWMDGATCLCYQVSCATSSSRGGGSISCPGHSNPLPSEPGAPGKHCSWERHTQSQCGTTSFSSSLAKHYKSCCTLK